MTYTVVRDFTDSNENSAENGNLHVYLKNDKYPFKNYAGSLTKDRIAELTDAKGPNASFDGPVIVADEDEATEPEESTKSAKK